ncbi:MAG: transposase [Methanosphaera sp.]|nr:transposase [Methanosphaera sp.]
MSYLDNNQNQTVLTFGKIDPNIPKNHISHYINEFVDDNFEYLDKKYEKKLGRPAFAKTGQMKLLMYGEYENKKSFEEISSECEYNIYYRYLSGNNTPSGRTLKRFMDDHGVIFQKALEKLCESKENITSIHINGKIMDSEKSDIDQLKQIDSFMKDLIKSLKKHEANSKVIAKEVEISQDAINIYESRKYSSREKINKLIELNHQIRHNKTNSMFITSIMTLLEIEKSRHYPVENNLSRKDYSNKLVNSVNITIESSDEKLVDKCNKIENEIALRSLIYNIKTVKFNEKTSYKDFDKFMDKLCDEYPDIWFEVN